MAVVGEVSLRNSANIFAFSAPACSTGNVGSMPFRVELDIMLNRNLALIT